MAYDLIVIGSGPGGYAAAIRASQLDMDVGVVESEALGGICLNWGCIPTKALLKSAEVYEYVQHASDYGIDVSDVNADFPAMVKRSRNAAQKMSKGIQFLFKKNEIDHIEGWGRVKSPNKVEVENDGSTEVYEADHILIATGAHSKELPNIPQDQENVIGYRQAMVLEEQPDSMVVIGAGAIGSEFAYFYNAIGTEVTLIEYMPRIVPGEDPDTSKSLEKSFKKQGIDIKTGTAVEEVDTSGKKNKVTFKANDKEETIKADVVLSAVGVEANTEEIGLDALDIETENDKIKVDEFYRTNIDGVYAIGDCIEGPALAHVATHEGITCVEKITGQSPLPIDYNNLPVCTYCKPQVASVGYTEEGAKDAGYDIKVGKFPFTASGKAAAAGSTEGFVKVIFDAKYGEWLGAHMIGDNVTEMIAEAVAARKLETTGKEIIKSVHPHPTMSEAVMEATADAFDEVIHL